MKAKVGQCEDESTDFMCVFPSFVWAVRDFTLVLIKEDKPITSDEYLEGALKLKPGGKKRVDIKHIQNSLLLKNPSQFLSC